MSYRIKADESVADAIRRIAREQIDKAVDEIVDPDLDNHKSVHQVRKRCKKLRGLLRLVRPELGDDYDRENAWYRDTARELSYVRDAQSMVETFDELMEHYIDQIDQKAFNTVSEGLVDRRQQIAREDVALQTQLDETVSRLREGRGRVAAWTLNDAGFDAIRGGTKKTYARGVQAMETAYKKPSTRRFHEWRKRAKYHGYHMRLLRNIWEAPLKARCDEVDALSDLLGDDHDLAILRKTLVDSAGEFGEAVLRQTLLGLIAQRQVELRTKANSLGARIFAEKPKRLVKRLSHYWDAWKNTADVAEQGLHRPDLVSH